MKFTMDLIQRYLSFAHPDTFEFLLRVTIPYRAGKIARRC
jgi:hypothetical protein